MDLKELLKGVLNVTGISKIAENINTKLIMKLFSPTKIITYNYNIFLPPSSVGEPPEKKLKQIEEEVESKPEYMEKTKAAQAQAFEEFLRKHPEMGEDEIRNIFAVTAAHTLIDNLAHYPTIPSPEEYEPEVIDPEKIYGDIKSGAITLEMNIPDTVHRSDKVTLKLSNEKETE